MVKKENNNAYWEKRDKAFNSNKEKAKYYNPSSFTNQPQIQVSKFKKRQGKRQRGLIIRINATK